MKKGLKGMVDITIFVNEKSGKPHGKIREFLYINFYHSYNTMLTYPLSYYLDEHKMHRHTMTHDGCADTHPCEVCKKTTIDTNMVSIW